MNAKRAVTFIFFFSLIPIHLPASTTEASELETLVKEIFFVPSVTGNEELLASRICALLPDTLSFERDNLGSVYVRLGRGEGRATLEKMIIEKIDRHDLEALTSLIKLLVKEY